MITLDALKALLESSDVSEQEEQRKNLLELGTGFRAMPAQIKGRDVGSNLGRAGYGIAGAVGALKGLQMSPTITAGKNTMYANLLRALLSSQESKYPRTNVREMDREQYGGSDSGI